jgi:hypothetical protein
VADENQPADVRVKAILEDWRNLTPEQKESFVVEGVLRDVPWNSIQEMVDRVDEETKQQILDRIEQETKLNLLNRLFDDLVANGQPELGEMIVFTWLNHLPYSSRNNILSGLVEALSPGAMLGSVVAWTADLPASFKQQLIHQLVDSLSPERRANMYQFVEALPVKAKEELIRRLVATLPADEKVKPEDALDTTDRSVDVHISEQASIKVHFSEQAAGEVKRLLRREDTDFATLITQALAFEKWYRDVRADGNRLLLERSRNKFAEVNRP